MSTSTGNLVAARRWRNRREREMGPPTHHSLNAGAQRGPGIDVRVLGRSDTDPFRLENIVE